jgi:hypothetical protein
MNEAAGVDALLERLAAGEIPETVRQGAARGALPLPAPDLLRVQVHLAMEDPSEAVRQTAAEALAGREPAETAALMRERELSGQVAGYFAALETAPGPVLEALAENNACPAGALDQLASRSEGSVLERLLLNEVRLTECSEVLATLEANPSLSPRQRDRLSEIRLHFVEQPLPQADPEQPPLDPEVAQEIVATMVEAEEYERESPQAPEPIVEEVPAEEEEEKLALFRIMEMSVAERVKLAFLGSAEERGILIRDSNRVVAAAVLKSPRVTEKDVEQYVHMKTLDEELLRIISSKREWIRSYQVTLGLVKHPKTAPRIVVNFLPRLHDRDLKNLTLDRNLSETTRQHVRRAFMARTQRRGGRR